MQDTRMLPGIQRNPRYRLGKGNCNNSKTVPGIIENSGWGN